MEAALEYAVERPGRGAPSPEQPTIEQIDRLLQQAAEAGCGFGSIHIPADPEKPEESLGDEISTVDGWADLASYAEFRAARITLARPEALSQPGPRQVLKSIIEYMNDMDLQVILDSTPSSLPWGMEFRDQHAMQLKHPLGLCLPWDWVNAAEGSPLPTPYIAAVRFDAPLPLNPGEITRRYRQIESRFGEFKPILVVSPQKG